MSGVGEENWSKKLIMYIIWFAGFGNETSSFSEIDAFFHSIFERIFISVSDYHFMLPEETIFVVRISQAFNYFCLLTKTKRHFSNLLT